MIKIKIPNNNINERKYIIDILFNEFLGLDYSIEIGLNDYEISIENGNKLIIKDGFFSNFTEDLAYLNMENIPSEVEYFKNIFTSEENVPVIYGDETLLIEADNITCGIDIFAASFFMLTRWEEYVNKNRDKLNRFSATESLAYKNNFLDRPIVNEYVEMLWNMLVHLGIKEKRKERSYQLYLTHDVDFLLLRDTPIKIIVKTIGGDILKRKNPKLAFLFLLQYLKSKTSIKNDPYDSYDYLMDLSEKVGVKSHFFFMGKGKTIYDNNYVTTDEFLQKLIAKIKKRGHNIGIHPTFDAYNNQEQLKVEKLELEKNLDTKITFGREHYLRFEVPTTWQIWEDNNMQWDSTMGYHDKEGFRCGVCYEYSVFNILTREKLNLKEKPLIVMEGSFLQYQSGLKLSEVKQRIIDLQNTIKKYNGDFVFLWHNSSFDNREWCKYQHIYAKVLK
jgi:hypothetical protein